ncbi:DNA repair protein RecO [Flavobacterium sp.]|uniref:DNA repair protein RecO n=1 Tax=Flavobacterium sp. TaxID=239 RepID=UPI003D0F4C5C
MQVKTRAIVLSALRYQEKSLIVKCFTQSQGIVSYFVPSAFSSKKNSQRIAYFQPLSILEIEANHKNKGGLEYFKEVKIAVPYQTIPFDVVKGTIVLFLAEILHTIIREEEANDSLYIFFETSLTWLDTHDNIANFHLFFLIELSKFLGFYPDLNCINLPFFDLVEGNFVSFPSSNTLDEIGTLLFKQFLVTKWHSNDIYISRDQRTLILNLIFKYYNCHIDGFIKPKSVEIFRTVFL